MSFRVIHYEGDKDLLVEKVKETADQLKNDVDVDDYGFDKIKWDHAVDLVVKGNFSGSKIVPVVLSMVIPNSFSPVSDDHKIDAYEDLAESTSGKLAQTLRMFVDGRNFATGNSGFGYDEISCGYLTPDEVREFLELLKAYTPDNTLEVDNDFVDDLIDIFSTLVKKNSGDLFIVT